VSGVAPLYLLFTAGDTDAYIVKTFQDRFGQPPKHIIHQPPHPSRVLDQKHPAPLDIRAGPVPEKEVQ
jgi:hypothetical protein